MPLKPLTERAFVPELGLQCVATCAPIGSVFNEQFDELDRALFFVAWKASDQPAMLLQGCVDQGKDRHGGLAFCGPLPAMEGISSGAAAGH